MSSPLDIFAGPKALACIQAEGFHQNLFDHVLGASGGPKWFVLVGLDRVIFPEFFAKRARVLNAVGTSAGAFRMACFAQQDPQAATERLAERYSQTRYSAKPTVREITEKGVALLDYVLGAQGTAQIINNATIKAHFIVARCRGLERFEPRPIQLLGLVSSATANLVSRRQLRRLYQRVIFAPDDSQLGFADPAGFSNIKVPLSTQNLATALMASGSIPLVLQGVKNIPGAPRGTYRDGGIIDYHFDLQLHGDGLVLYPHFYPIPKPGWFDKSLKRRLPLGSSYDNVVMLVPSAEFVAKLPFAKIPDRKDFETMPANERIAYWQQVMDESNRLGEAFMQFAQSADPAAQIKPLPWLV